MKKVIFVRHAKSLWNDFRLTDFDRPLDKRGLHDAPKMAKLLKSEGIRPDIIYSSDANRARSTAIFFATEFDMDIIEKHNLYHGSPEDYMDVIRDESQQTQVVALFGHNPGMTYLANMISPGCTDNIPTCSIIITEFKLDSWAKCDWSALKLLKILTPKNSFYD